MKIISFNVNGLRARIKDNTIFEIIELEKPDILCLQEIKCKEEDIKDFIEKINSIYPFQFYNSSIEKRGYSGTAILSKYRPRKEFKEPIITNEGRIITLFYDNFILINLYSPNSGRELKRLNERINYWEKKLDELIKNYIINYPNYYIVICGDFNVASKEIDINLKSTNINSIAGFTKEERESHNSLIFSNNLVDIFRFKNPIKREFTWFGKYINAYIKNIDKMFGMRIDKFLISKNLIKCVKNIYSLQTIYGSDHIPIILETFN